MKFTKIPQNTFEELQVNAGILLKDFDPETGTYDDADMITATTGGITISVKPTFEDYGSDVDNCPKNMAELKRITEHEVTLSTTALNISKELLLLELGAADEDAITGAIKPRKDLKMADFGSIWWVGDMANNGFIAVKILNALSTDGFSLKTTDKGKGNISIGFTGHVSMDAQDVVPAEFYISEDPELVGKISLNKGNISIPDGDTFTLIADVYPAGTSVTWASTDTSVATVSNGVVTAEAEGVCVITAKITTSGQSFIASCNVTVTEAESEG